MFNSTLKKKELSKFTSILIFLLGMLFACKMSWSQTTLFSDNFGTSRGSSFSTTAGAIGTDANWLFSRSGVDFGARIDAGLLDLTNDASATTNVSGWVFGYRDINSLSGWNTTLSANTGTITWEFNMRQTRTDPAGFSAGSYGVAYVLAGTSTTAATSGSGYAIVLGQSGSTDAIRLAHFNNGLQGTLTNIISGNTSGLTDFGADYISVRVTYIPSSNTWELFLRNDGTTAFTDPSTGTLVSQGTAVNSSYTSTAGMRYIGGYWQGSTAANEKAFFDNVFLKKTEAAPSITAVSFGSALAATSYGTPSAGSSFTAAGINLTGNIIVTAQSGFEVSTTSGSGYGPSVSVASGTTVFVRTSGARSAGAFNNTTLAVMSGGGAASNANVTSSASNNAVTAQALTITGLSAANKDFDGTTSVSVTGTPAYSGLVNGETFSVTGTVSWAFADATVGSNKALSRTGSFDAPSANYTVTQPALTATISAVLPGAPSITSITGGNNLLTVAFTAPSFTGGASISNYEYSSNNGGSFTACSPAQTTSPLTISGLTNGTTYDVQIRAVNSVGAGTASSAVQGTPEAPASPTVYATGSIASMTTTYGTASSATSFSVSGTALTDSLYVTAPSGFEISLTNGTSGFASVQAIPSVSGVVSSTTVFVRISATAAAGSVSGNVVVSSAGASNANMAISSSTVSVKDLTISGLSAASKEYDRTTSVSVSGTPQYVGLANGESFSVTGSVSWAFANALVGNGKVLNRTGSFDAPSANYSVTQPQLSADITRKGLTVLNAAGVSKTFNGNTAATFTGSLNGIISPDVVTLNPIGIFATANAGVGIAITSTATLGGADTANYSLVHPTGLTADINKANQTITFAALQSRTTADTPFVLTGTASSGLAVSYTSSNTSVATVSGNLVTITGAGVTTITASQVGNGNYNAATDVARTLTVTFPVIAAWDFAGVASSGVSAFAATTFNANLVSTTGLNTITRGDSAAVSSGSNSFRTTGFRNNGISTSNKDFFQTTLKTQPGFTLSLNSILANFVGTNTYYAAPGVTSQFAYSTNGTTFTLIGSPTITTTLSNVVFDLSGEAALQNIAPGTTLYIRYYASGQTPTGGWGFGSASTAGTNGLAFSGSVSAVPLPVITSSLSVSDTVGTPFTYSLTASNFASSYAATGLPAGLSINSTTGLISGTPTVAGVFRVGVSATNGTGTTSDSLTITLAKGSQNITFNALTARTFGGASFTLNGTSSAGLPVSYSSSNTGVVSISGNTVTITGAGNATITASQAGDDNWNAAVSVDQLLTVNKANQVITFAALPNKFDTSSAYSLGATTTSGLPISYTSSDTSKLKISGDVVTIFAAGTVSITASQAGNDNFNAATPVSQNQLIINTSLSDQIITFDSLSSKTYGDASFALTATANSGLSVSYSSSNTSVATVSGDIVTVLLPGTTTITATQAGNGSYNPAPSVSRTLIVDKKMLTVTGVVANNKIYNANTAATLDLSGASLVGVVGSDTVTFSGNGTFADANAGLAKPVSANITLGGAQASRYNLTQPVGLTANINKASQTITFATLPNKLTTDSAFSLNGTASSGLALTYSSSNTSVATVTGNVVTLVGAGNTNITASQSGDGNYEAATSITRLLTVSNPPQSVTWNFGTTTSDSTSLPVGGANVISGLTISRLSRVNNNGATNLLTTTSNSTPYTGMNVQAALRNGGFNRDTSTYFEFTLSPGTARKVTLNSISFGQRSTSTGPQALSIRSSLDGYATNLASATVGNNSTWVAVNPTISPIAGDFGAAITIRIYGHSNSGTASYLSGTANWRIDNLALSITMDNAPNCESTPTAGTATASPASICNSGSAVISLSGQTNINSASGLSHQWYSSTDGSNFSVVAGANASSLQTGTITQTTYYYCQTACSFSGLSANSNTVTVTVNSSSSSTNNHTVCSNQLPFVWNGASYSNSGTYSSTGLINAVGCDSIAVLNLTVNATSSSVNPISVCPAGLPYVWNGDSYASSGTYTKTGFVNAAGCDSVAILSLMLLSNSSSNTPVSVCPSALPYNWNGVDYSQSGTYSKTGLTNAAGCDSVATLVLMINSNSSSTTSVSVCPSALPYTWNGNSYSEAGFHTKTGLTNAVGCDSVAILSLTIKSNSSSTTSVSVCPSALPYSWNSDSYTSAGVYTKSGFTNAAGCDSSAILNLSVTSSSVSNSSVGVCSYNLPYSWNGASYSASGTYTKTGLTAASGCDSVAILNLSVNSATSSINNLSVCSNALPYTWNGKSYNGPVVDTVNFSGGNANGCDSIAILNLSIKQSTQSITYRAICSATGQTTSWNGDTYAAAGVYTTPLVNAAGCDSLAILDLTATATAPLATATSAITQTLVDNNCGARVYRYTAAVVANAVGYAWDLTKLNTLAPGAVVDSGDATFSRVIRIRYALNAAAGSTDSIAVRPFSGCGQGARKAAKLSNLAWTPLASPSITARNVITNVCNGRVIRYSVPVPATTAGTNVGYLWSIQGSTLGATAVIDSGTATSRQILVLFSDNRAAGGDDSIVCRYVFNNGCAFSRRASKMVLAALATPAAPTLATSTVSSNECGNRKIRYRVTSAFLPGATATAPATTGIEWSFTGTGLGASATIDSPSAPSAWATANAIVVRFASDEAAVTTDSVRARYTTACGFGLYARSKVALTRLRPAAPLSITIASVPSNECGTVRFRYTAATFPLPTATTAQATGYDWDFSTLGSMSLLYTIDSGDVSGRAIIVKYATNAAALSTDSIRVRYTSTCGSSAFRAVKLTNVLTSTNPPVIPASITISIVDTTICGGRIYRYTAPVLPVGTATNSAPTGYLWSLPTGPVGSTGTLVNGTTLTSRIIDVAYSSNAAATSTDSIRVAYTSPCGAGPTKAAKLTNLAKTNCVPTSRAMPTTRTVPTTVPMDVKVFPNPSTAAFNMQVKSAEQEVVEVRILDAQGRFVRALRSVSNATINFGSDLRAGVYMVEVRQGNKVKTTRIVKL